MCPAYRLNKLQKVQNSAVRLIHDAKKRDSASKLLKMSHFLPVKFRIKYKQCLIIFKCLNGDGPGYLSQNLIYHDPPRDLRVGRDSHTLLTELTNKSLFTSFIDNWNSLPLSIRCIPDTNSFKKKLKTFLFNEAYELYRDFINRLAMIFIYG